MPIEHSDIGTGEIHLLYNWSVADATALAALTPVAGDVGKIALQQDTKQLWRLEDDSPLTFRHIGHGLPADVALYDNGTSGLTATNVQDAIDELVVSGAPPSGAAGGDLTGTYPNPTVDTGKITLAKLAAAIRPSGTAAAGDEAVRALGTGANNACAGNDARLSDSRTPSGAAGGDLAGTYPNPTVAQAAAAFAFKGILSPAQITSNQNDYNPTSLSTAAILRLDLDADRSLTGLAGGADGRFLIVRNISAFVLTLKDQSASSSAANRFALGADVTVAAGGSVSLWYDNSAARWYLIGSSGGGAVTSAALDSLLGSTQGSIAYRNATVWTALGPGSNGQFLKTQGAAANPVWSTPSGLGLTVQFALTAPPAASNFTAVNQGTSTLTDVADGLLLEDLTGSGTLNARIWTKAIPAAPFTRIVAFKPNITPLNFVTGGYVVRSSSSGALWHFGWYGDSSSGGNWKIAITKWNSPTSFGSTVATYAPLPGSLLFLKYEDDNTNRKVSFSMDGVNYVQLFTEGRTVFLTPDEEGIMLTVNHTSAKGDLGLIHWA